MVVARDCLAKKTDENWRSAINRAYYCAFNISRDYVDPAKTQLSNERVHKQVIDALRAPTRSALEKTLGRRLKRAKEIRTDADYENPYPNPTLEYHAKFAVSECQEILNTISRLKGK